jgi:DnaJ-class molecular chaperone
LVAQPARKCALCGGDGLYLPKGGILTKKVCTACRGSGWAHVK